MASWSNRTLFCVLVVSAACASATCGGESSSPVSAVDGGQGGAGGASGSTGQGAGGSTVGAGGSGTVGAGGASGTGNGGSGGVTGTAGSAGNASSGGMGGTAGAAGKGGTAGGAGKGGAGGNAGKGGSAGGAGTGSDGGLSCGGLVGNTCGSEGYCEFEPRDCRAALDLSGTCRPRPTICTKDCPGVCGCDGKVYCNACLAHSAGVDDTSDTTCLRLLDAGARGDAGAGEPCKTEQQCQEGLKCCPACPIPGCPVPTRCMATGASGQCPPPPP